jgi:hypothetical protein
MKCSFANEDEDYSCTLNCEMCPWVSERYYFSG